MLEVGILEFSFFDKITVLVSKSFIAATQNCTERPHIVQTLLQ